jgi:hypothetical protein
MAGFATAASSVLRKVNDAVILTVTLTKNGLPQSGKTVLGKLVRRSDGKFYNFNLNVFQVATFSKTLVENPSIPGVYEATFDHNTADPDNEDEYLGIFTANGVPADRFYGVVEYVFRNRTVDEVVNGTSHFKVDSVGYSMTLIRNRFQTGFAVLDNTTFNAKGHLLTGRWRIFDTKALADAATDGGTGEGEIATIEVTATTEPGNDKLTKLYKAIRQP